MNGIIGKERLNATAAVGAAAVIFAALSAYWTSTSHRHTNKSGSGSESGKNDDDDDVVRSLLGRLEEMQLRLADLEDNSRWRATRVDDDDDKKGRGAADSGDGRNRNMNMGVGGHRRRHQQRGWERDDSNVNVPPHNAGSDDDEEEDSIQRRYRAAPLPQTIVTNKWRKKKDRALSFLSPRRRSSGNNRAAVADSSASDGGGGDEQPDRHGGGGNNGNNAASASASTKHREPVPVVLISDPGQDLDDEMMFIMARHLASLDLISLQGVIANLSPSFARARLTRGTLDLLGLHRVPVGIGTDGGDVLGKHSSDQFETTASSYIVHEDGEAARGLESGHRLLQRLYDDAADIEYVDVVYDDDDDDDDDYNNFGAEIANDDDDREEDGVKDDSSHKDDENNAKTASPRRPVKKVAKGGLTVVITSSMKDIAIFVRDNPTLFASKTREVVVMGGCKPVQIKEGSQTPVADLSATECEPDSANNNTFDPDASSFFYSQCQKMNITLTVVSRYAAYAAKMPRSVYDDLALTGSSIGWRLRNSQRASIDQLWQRACSDDPTVRKGLPPRCDRKWFINTFCGGDDDPSRCSSDTAWDLVTGFMQYDTIALLAAIPAVREKYFDPFVLPPLRRSRLVESPSSDNVFNVSEEDETVPSGSVARRMSSSGVDSLGDSRGMEGGDWRGTRRATCPEPIQRAIARAKEDNRMVETPFDEPSGGGSSANVPPVPFDRGTRNLIGVSDKEHSLKDPSLLVGLLKTGYRQGILCNHHTQPHIILHLQLRWDNLADTLLTCLMLRSLWDMRLASVLGVIVSISPGESDKGKVSPQDDVSVSKESEENNAAEGVKGRSGKERRQSDVTAESSDESNKAQHSADHPTTLSALAESIRATLSSIGLAHVKFKIVSGKDMDEHRTQSAEAFLKLYESAPPIGVTLVLTATFTGAWPFAESHPDLFRNKTVRVVHTGGALIWPARWGWAALPFSHNQKEKENEKNDTEDPSLDKGELTSEQILVPDPAAQNHRLDMSSARLFYKRAQALSVPMVILSRHVAKECCIPRNFFDVLGSHGGMVGKRIYSSERDSLLKLWRCSCAPVGSAARGNLPERCDRQWFTENFCAGKEAGSEEEVWQSVEAVNLYSPIALLAALPGETVRSYFQTMPFHVRSATHHVIGLTEEVPPRNVTNPSELRSLVVQSLLSAALANESEFGQDPPPMVPVRMDHEQRWGKIVDSNNNGYGTWCNSNLTSSIISTVSNNAVDEVEDMWTFSEAARRELFSRTVAQTSKNAILPKEKKRKFVMTNESRIAATIGFIPPQNPGDED